MSHIHLLLSSQDLQVYQSLAHALEVCRIVSETGCRAVLGIERMSQVLEMSLHLHQRVAPDCPGSHPVAVVQLESASRWAIHIPASKVLQWSRLCLATARSRTRIGRRTQYWARSVWTANPGADEDCCSTSFMPYGIHPTGIERKVRNLLGYKMLEHMQVRSCVLVG